MRAVRGFTLFELIVVISIVGLLLSLLVVAVQAMRESARQAYCSQNLQQIGLALQNYEATYKKLPRGSGPVGNGPLVAILPFIEQSTVFNRIDFSKDVDGNPAGKEAIRLYRCPSTTSDRPQRTDYMLNRGTTLADHRDSPWHIEERTHPRSSSFSRGTTQTALMAEACSSREPSGVGQFIQLEYRRIGSESNSDRFRSECIYAPSNPPVDGIGLDNGSFWFGAGTHNYFHILPPNERSCANGGQVQNSLYTTNSLHRGGVNVLFADGHCSFVSDGIDREAWSNLGAR